MDSAGSHRELVRLLLKFGVLQVLVQKCAVAVLACQGILLLM
jgi:hypothetical protein